MSCEHCEYETEEQVKEIVRVVIEGQLTLATKDFLKEVDLKLDKVVKEYCDNMLVGEYKSSKKIESLDSLIKQRLQLLFDDGTFNDMTSEMYSTNITSLKEELKDDLTKEYRDALIKIDFLQQKIFDFETDKLRDELLNKFKKDELLDRLKNLEQ